MCVPPLVSVIMPCYNQAPFIAEALDSLLAQTFTEWECIVVDDGSTDDSIRIAGKYAKSDPRIKVLTQKNQGVSIARNNAIANSSGSYILPFDSDDKIATDYIRKAFKVLDENKEVKLVYCKAKLFGAKQGLWKLPDYSYEKLLWSNMIFNCAMFRRVDFDKTKGFNPNMQHGLEDWDFWLSLLNPSDKVVRIDEVLFFYRIKKISRNKNAAKHDKELRQLIFSNHIEAYLPYIKDVIIWHNFYEKLSLVRTIYNKIFFFRK